MEKAINAHIGDGFAEMLDSGTVRVKVDRNRHKSIAHLISEIENIQILTKNQV